MPSPRSQQLPPAPRASPIPARIPASCFQEGLPTSNDHSKPTVGLNVPDSDYESEAEVEAPKASDVQLYDNDMFCSIELMDDGLWDKAEEERYRHESVISGQVESFHRVVRRFNPPISYDHVGLYRHWLLTSSPNASEWSEDLILWVGVNT